MEMLSFAFFAALAALIFSDVPPLEI